MRSARPRLRLVGGARRFAWFGALLGCGLVSLALAAASAPAAGGSGEITGQIPTCYGPGLDLNLTPVVAVTVTRDGVRLMSMSFPDTDAHHTYRFQLPAGDYRIGAGLWPPRPVHVAAGRTTTADLPGVACM